MFDLFAMGGPLFMGIITFGFLGVIVATIRSLALRNSAGFKNSLSLIKQAGLFSAVMGILGQMIGLYNAFQAIEEMGSVSQAMLFGGLKVSSTTTIYGFIVFGIALGTSFLLNATRMNKENQPLNS